MDRNSQTFTQRFAMAIRNERDAAAKRGGVSAMEVLLALPVLLVLLAAAVEFGLILANVKYLPVASRTGAKLLAETPQTSLNSSATMTAVRQAVDSALSVGRIASCRVILEHNVDVASLQQTGSCSCSPPGAVSMPSDGGGSVRVTVCVPLSQLAPNLLAIVGFSTEGRLVQATTTYPYEDP